MVLPSSARVASSSGSQAKADKLLQRVERELTELTELARGEERKGPARVLTLHPPSIFHIPHAL